MYLTDNAFFIESLWASIYIAIKLHHVTGEKYYKHTVYIYISTKTNLFFLYCAKYQDILRQIAWRIHFSHDKPHQYMFQAMPTKFATIPVAEVLAENQEPAGSSQTSWRVRLDFLSNFSVLKSCSHVEYLKDSGMYIMYHNVPGERCLTAHKCLFFWMPLCEEQNMHWPSKHVKSTHYQSKSVDQ